MPEPVAPDDLDDLISQTLGDLDEADKAEPEKEVPVDAKAAAADLKACVNELKAPEEASPEQMLMKMLQQMENPEFREQMEQAVSSLGLEDAGDAAAKPAPKEQAVQGPRTQAESQEWDQVSQQLDGMVEKARADMHVDENMRVLIDKFEIYMRDKAATLEPSERERFTKQLGIYKRIEELSQRKDDQQTPELFSLLSQLHALGDPPKEIAPDQGGPDLSDAELQHSMAFLGKMAEYGQQGEAGIEKLVTEMAPEMDKMMEELLKNAPPDAQKAAEQVSEECKQQ